MENIYSPPIGALFEPIAIAAQNGLAELAKAEASGAGAGMTAAERMQRRLRAQAEHHLRVAAMKELRPGTPRARPRRDHGRGGASGGWPSSPPTGACRGRPSSAR